MKVATLLAMRQRAGEQRDGYTPGVQLSIKRVIETVSNQRNPPPNWFAGPEAVTERYTMADQGAVAPASRKPQ